MGKLKRLVTLPLFLFCILTTLIAQPPNNGWQYSRNITISATPVADYQVKVELTSGQYTGIQTSGNDIRFVVGASTLCSYYIETWNTSGTSTIWVKVPTASTTSIVLWYGNNAASAASSGDATFDFFDSFDGSSINSTKWNVFSGNSVVPSVSGGQLLLSSGAYVGGSGWQEGSQVTGKTAFQVSASNGFAVETRGVTSSPSFGGSRSSMCGITKNTSFCVLDGPGSPACSDFFAFSNGRTGLITPAFIGRIFGLGTIPTTFPTGYLINQYLPVDLINPVSGNLEIQFSNVGMTAIRNGDTAVKSTYSPSGNWYPNLSNMRFTFAGGANGYPGAQTSTIQEIKVRKFKNTYIPTAIVGNQNATAAPTFTSCPTNISAFTSTGTCDKVVTYTATANQSPTYTYNFTGASINSGSGTGTGSSFNKGVTSVTLTATNNLGSATCAFTVTVTDNVSPTITCASNVTAGFCLPGKNLRPPTATDNCPKLGNALNFDGVNDFVHIPNNASQNVGTNFTLECWFKSGSNNSGYRALIDKRKVSTSPNHSNFSLSVFNGTDARFYINNGIDPEVLVNSPGVLTPGNWYHYALTYDGTDFKQYVNGSLINTLNQSLPNGNPLQNEPIIIGATYGASEFFDGSIDEVRIWSSTRTIGQIQASMNSELGAQGGLIARYSFNEGTAAANNSGLDLVWDDSGTSNNGQLLNAALTGASSNYVAGNVMTYTATTTNNAPVTILPGVTTVTYTATDASGNTATCQRTITIIDTQAPTLIGTLPTGQTGMSYCMTAAPAGPSEATIAALYSDNCGTVTVTKSGNVTGDNCSWNVTYTYDVFDSSGNHVVPSPTVIYSR